MGVHVLHACARCPFAGAVLAAICLPALSAAVHIGSAYGLFAALLALPALWLACGAALCMSCVLTSRALQPRLSPSRPIGMYSVEFARWWLVRFHPHALGSSQGACCMLACFAGVIMLDKGQIFVIGQGLHGWYTDGINRWCGLQHGVAGMCAQVSRLVNVTTFMFAEHLRGSPFLTWWYRAMVRALLQPAPSVLLLHKPLFLHSRWRHNRGGCYSGLLQPSLCVALVNHTIPCAWACRAY